MFTHWEGLMINNYEEKLLKNQQEFETLVKLVTEDWQELEIHKVEENLFKRVLKLGHDLLELHLTKRGSGKEDYHGEIPYHSDKGWDYISVFGDIHINRAYFWEEGLGKGIYPLNGELNLPERHHSYVLQKWGEMIAVDGTFDKAREVVHEILGINIWSKQMEEINREAGEYVDRFYNAHPKQEQKEPILVVEVDSKGVVMKKEGDAENKVRLKKGEKPNKKKMATVTAVFGTEKNVRSAEDIVKEELGNGEKEKANSLQIVKLDTKDEPRPQDRYVRATLRGKEVAFERLVKEIEHRDPHNRCERVALMDGESALEKKTLEYLPGFVIITDLFHVMEKLWELCYFFCDEGTQEAKDWVRKYLYMLLRGKVGYMIGAIKQKVTKGDFSKSKTNKISKILRYLEKRKKYMRYDEYLSKGYPIGSGVIEGLCRSFVKDRMELSGMRWTERGAEAMLELRSAKVNGVWTEFWDYYIDMKKNELYQNQISTGELENAA
jgi:hypothetical protein